jgi:hypothetical protein
VLGQVHEFDVHGFERRARLHDRASHHLYDSQRRSPNGPARLRLEGNLTAIREPDLRFTVDPHWHGLGRRVWSAPHPICVPDQLSADVVIADTLWSAFAALMLPPPTGGRVACAGQPPARPVAFDHHCVSRPTMVFW